MIDHNFYIVHNLFCMSRNLRKNVRFNDFGRADCPSICPVPGVLDDISLTGCKIHYDAPVMVNLESDYEIHIRLSRASVGAFVLMCHPQWQKQKEDGSTEVGFIFLHSPDSTALENYIQQLQSEQIFQGYDDFLPQGDTCQFV